MPDEWQVVVEGVVTKTGNEQIAERINNDIETFPATARVVPVSESTRARAHYRIIKFRRDKPPVTRGLPRHLTLDEAQRYCRREDTHGAGWFCGYDVEG
jgi:hypothetical protein